MPVADATHSLWLDSVDLNVHSELSPGIGQLTAQVVLKDVPNPVELHDVPRLALQPELVELDEQVTESV